MLISSRTGCAPVAATLKAFALTLGNQNISARFSNKNHLCWLASSASSYVSTPTSVTRLLNCLQVADGESPCASPSRVRLSYNLGTWSKRLARAPGPAVWICPARHSTSHCVGANTKHLFLTHRISHGRGADGAEI